MDSRPGEASLHLFCLRKSLRNLCERICQIISYSTIWKVIRLYPIKNYPVLSSNYKGKRWAYAHFIREAATHLILLHYPIKNYRCCTGGPLLIMGNNYPCMFPICCAWVWQEIWHTGNCLIYGVKLDLYAERLIYREKECLYAERNGHFTSSNNLKKIVSLTSICIFSSYFLFVDASLIKMRK